MRPTTLLVVMAAILVAFALFCTWAINFSIINFSIIIPS